METIATQAPPPQTLEVSCLAVLKEEDTRAKADLAIRAYENWQSGAIKGDFDQPFDLPDRPGRPAAPELRDPHDMPKRRLGSEAGRRALIHALAHIELNAIDLAVDMAARFYAECSGMGFDAPTFVGDWLRIASEEASHFVLLDDRLKALGSFYGQMPAHDGLWEAAIATKDDWAARLAIVPMVLEARGLDVSPNTIKLLRKAGDATTANILQRIYEDEIGHVEVGTTWFKRICSAKNVDEVTCYHDLIHKHFKGSLKPPFNDEARLKAGLLPNFYRPLAK